MIRHKKNALITATNLLEAQETLNSTPRGPKGVDNAIPKVGKTAGPREELDAFDTMQGLQVCPVKLTWEAPISTLGDWKGEATIGGG